MFININELNDLGKLLCQMIADSRNNSTDANLPSLIEKTKELYLLLINNSIKNYNEK
jgi:hypothetical protein